MSRNALVLNDTSGSQHPGCVLVMRQLHEMCKSEGIDIVATLPTNSRLLRDMAALLSRCDIVMINGEGTMHHDRLGALLLRDAAMMAAACGKPVVLINTVWEGNVVVNDMLPLMSMVCVRESLSKAAIDALGFCSDVIPDLIFSAQISRAPTAGGSCRDIIIFDDVRTDLSFILARYARRMGIPFHRMEPMPSPRQISRYPAWMSLVIMSGFRSQFRCENLDIVRDAGILVTGRYHGACLAMMLGRPFIAVPSNTHKIEGLLEDANLGPGACLLGEDFLKPGEDAIDSAVNRIFELMRDECFVENHKARCEVYVEHARKTIASMFGNICDLCG